MSQLSLGGYDDSQNHRVSASPNFQRNSMVITRTTQKAKQHR